MLRALLLAALLFWSVALADDVEPWPTELRFLVQSEWPPGVEYIEVRRLAGLVQIRLGKPGEFGPDWGRWVEPVKVERADVNCDGGVNMNDIFSVQNAIFGSLFGNNESACWGEDRERVQFEVRGEWPRGMNIVELQKSWGVVLARSGPMGSRSGWSESSVSTRHRADVNCDGRANLDDIFAVNDAVFGEDMSKYDAACWGLE